MEKCLDKQLIPKGFQLCFPLAHAGGELLVDNIQKTLEAASSNILYLLKEETENDIIKNEKFFTDLCTEIKHEYGDNYFETLMSDLVVKHEYELNELTFSHRQKRCKLQEEIRSKRQSFYSRGSLIIRSIHLKPKAHNSSRRPHRLRRRGKKGKRKKRLLM